MQAQKRIIDSLETEIKSAKEDTSKANKLNKLSLILWRTGGYENSIQAAQKAKSLSEKLNHKRGTAIAYNNLGTIYWYQANYKNSLDAYIKSLVIMEELGNKPGISDANNNIGMVYYYMGKYDKTIEFYKKSLKIDEELGSKSGVALSYNNIGSVYDGIANDAVGFKNNKLALPNYDTAIAYYSKSLTICLEIKNKKGLMLNYNNLGATFCGKGNCSSSEGNSLEAAANYKKAIQFHEKSLALKKESGDKNGIAGSFVSLGEINLFLKNYKEAITYFNEGLSLAKTIGAKERIKFAFAGLSKSYAGMREFEKAYDYHVEFADVKDSIYNEETSQQMADMQEKYQSEKKEQQIKLLNKDSELQVTQLRKQQIIIWSTILGLLLAIVSGVFIFNRFKVTQKQKRIIENQKTLVEHQKHLVEEKQKEILDSIYYARRIQRSLLTSEKYIDKNLKKLKK